VLAGLFVVRERYFKCLTIPDNICRTDGALPQDTEPASSPLEAEVQRLRAQSEASKRGYDKK
jgi:hypothetical protein